MAEARELYKAYTQETERTTELSAKLESAKAECHQELGKQRVEAGVELKEFQNKYQELLRIFEQTVEQRNEAYEQRTLMQKELEDRDEELARVMAMMAQFSQEKPEVRSVIKENLELKVKLEALESEVLEIRNMLSTQPSVQAESQEWVTDAALAAGLDKIFVEVQDWVNNHVVAAPYCK